MKPAPHERIWPGLDQPVDKGLKDEWLEAINGLHYFQCYSSCEGHLKPAGAGWSPHPRIWFSLEDPNLIEQISPRWRANAPGFEELVRNWFPPAQTDVVFRLGNIGGGGKGVCLHLDCRIKRTTEQMPAVIEIWFDRTTKNLKTFEDAFRKLCGI